jgi:hypothetical protein
MRWQSNGLAQWGLSALYDDRANGEIGDEVTVHDVDVDEIGARRGDGLHLLAQACEIRG